MAHRTTIGVTPEHEVYTEEQGWRYVSELETSSSLVDASGAPLTMVAIEVDPTPRPVYNLETSCATYLAQGAKEWIKRFGKQNSIPPKRYHDMQQHIIRQLDLHEISVEDISRLSIGPSGDVRIWQGSVSSSVVGNIFDMFPPR